MKLVKQDGELYILVRSGARRDNERAMQRRRLKNLVNRLHELRQQKLTRDQLLIEPEAAREDARPRRGGSSSCNCPRTTNPSLRDVRLRLNGQTLRETRRREGNYLLRSNLTSGDPAQLWGSICN